MPSGKRPSSCEACKHSRIGCNVLSQAGGPCFNCTRRGIRCFLRQVQNGASRSKSSAPNKDKDFNITESPRCGHSVPPREENGGILAGPIPSLSGAQSSITRSQQALQLHQILWGIFTVVLEPRIGLWIGGCGCPLTTMTGVSILVFGQLLLTSLVSDHPRVEAHDLPGLQF